MKVATFTDANPNATASDFTATITWGDGTTSAARWSSTGNGFAVTAPTPMPRKAATLAA